MAIKEGKPIVDTKEALDENNRKRKMNLKAVAKEAMAKNKRDYKEQFNNRNEEILKKGDMKSKG